MDKPPMGRTKGCQATRRELMDELRRSEAQYRSTVDSITDALHVVDSDLRIVLINKPFLEWHQRLGISTDVIGKRLHDLYDFLPGEVEDEYRKVFATGEALITEESTRIGDSDIITETRKIPVFENGDVVKAITIIRDITERKKVEEALKASEEKYGSLFHCSNDAILLHDMDGNLVDINQRTLDFLGYKKEELLRMKIPDLHPPEAQPISSEAFRTIARRGHVKFEIGFRRKDGSVFPAEVSSSIFEISGRKVIQDIVRDFTERKSMEDALRQSEAKFKTLAERSPSMIFMNLMGKIVYVNKKCTEIMGYTKEEFYAPNFEFLCVAAPESIKELAEGYSAYLDGRGYYSHETTLVTKSGRKIDCIVAWCAVDYGDGKAMLGVVTDITDRKNAERALRASEEKYRSFVENFHGIAYRGGVDGTPVFFHGDVRGITGYTEEDFLRGMPSWVDIVLPEDRPILQRGPLMESLTGGVQPAEREYRIRRRDGQVRWIHQSVMPIRDAAGDAIYFQGALYDVTERRVALDTIARERSAFGIIAEAAIKSLDVSGVCAHVLNGLADTLGFDCGTIRLYDHNAKTLRLVGTHGLTRSEVERYVGDQHIDDPGYVAAKVGRTLTPVWAPDVSASEDLKQYLERLAHMRVRSMISWPLVSAAGRLIGVIHLLGREPMDISEQNRGFFRTIADMFAVVLERKQAETALRESEARYRGRFENSPIALWEEDFSGLRRYIDALRESGVDDFEVYFNEHPEGVAKCAEAVKIIGANKAAMDLYDTRTLQEFEKVSTGNIRARTLEAFRKGLTLLAEGSTQFELDYETVTAHGEERFVRLRWSVAPGCERTLERVLVSVVDLTERKEAEEIARRAEIQLRRHSEELEEMVKDRTSRIGELERQRTESEKLAATGRMAARIAHEINNPLAGIKNSFLLLQEIMDKNHPHYQYAERVQREIDRIAGIIRKMFDLYRPDPTKRSEVCLDEVIRDVTGIMESTCRAAGVEIVVELPETPLRAALPVGYFNQVLFNLIQNAVEASNAGDAVSIRLRTERDSVIVEVSDRGSGISEDLRKRIFEPFFTTKSNSGGKGLGLGLAVSKGMVEAMGGTITFEDNQPGGTRFILTLPLHEQARGV